MIVNILFFSLLTFSSLSLLSNTYAYLFLLHNISRVEPFSIADTCTTGAAPPIRRRRVELDARLHLAA
jgi:hypothetical protein